MARPRRSEKTRQDLLDLGVSVLSEKGYNGTGIKEILDSANVPKGSFYNFFKSKEDFAVEIIEHYGQDALSKMDAFIASAQDYPADEVLKTIYQTTLKAVAAQGCRKTCLVGSLASEIGASSDACRDALDQQHQQWLIRLNKLIATGQQQGKFRADIESTTLAGVFWNQWQGSLLTLKVDQTVNGAKETLDAMLKLLYIAD